MRILSLEQITALNLMHQWISDQGADVRWGQGVLIVRPKWPSDYFLKIVFNGQDIGSFCQGRQVVVLMAKANIYDERQFTDFKRRLFSCIVIKNAGERKDDCCPCELICESERKNNELG